MRVKMPSLNSPQYEFTQLPNKFRAFVAGFGSGKTWVGCANLCLHFFKNPNVPAGYFAPTYSQIRDIFYPTIEEVAEDWGLECDVQVSHKEVHLSLNGERIGTIICRSMDKPASIIGFKIGHALVDELDTMPTDKARHAWRKIMARMRFKGETIKNGIDVTTTPEGFKFVYEQFVKLPNIKPELKENYAVIHASTYDNEANLPDDYINSLRESYPPELIDAYLNGQFCNLTSGTIYKNYDRKRCNSNETIKTGEPLFIGQDFNVGAMASTVYVKRVNGWHAVDQLTGIFDTPELCKVLKERYAGHKITIYPDASGNSRKTVNASESDISLLKQAGFTVKVNASNPRVKDRILAVNGALANGKMWVNASKCPDVVACLEQQAYDKNGEPDKQGGFDHQNDATGYPIVYEMPVRRPSASGINMSGF